MGKGRPRAVEKGGPGHCPSSYQAPALPQAPVYYPSETEFLDPLSFIAKIRPEAETYGICRIVPPKGWNPPFALDLSSFSFQTKSQAIHRLQSRPAACDPTTFELEYTRFLENHCGRKPKKRAAFVVFEGEDLSLCSLFNAVKRFGGYDKVLKDKRWGEVLRFVRSDDKKKRIPKITECSKRVLCQLYREHLYDYEQYCSGLNSRGCTRDKDCKRKSSGDGATGSGSCGFKRHRRKNAEIKVERETELDNSDQICEQCKSGLHGDLMLLCDRCNKGWHLYCLTPPLEKVPPGDWYCLECVNSDKDSFGFVLGKRLSLDAFKKVAEKARRKWLGASGSISRSAIERKFWDIVEGSLGMVEVMYGSDLDTSLCGSGFPRERDPLPPSVEPDVWKKYCSSPWNLNNLPKLEGSMLQHIHDNIAGVMVPWLYMGMLFSSFCWHFEDHCFYSMNYLHWGEPKCWYSVPGNEAHAFEQVMRKTLPDLFDAQPDLLFQLVTMLNPSVLQEHGVPVYGALQEPGNFIITFPRSYHGGFNFGLNCAEAVNFAPADWLPHGGFGAELYRLYHKAPVLSHEELLCVLAKGSCSSSVLPYLKEEVSRVFMKEKFCREKLWTNGIVKSSLMSPRKQPEYVSAEEDPTCIVCQQYLFLSAVVCSCRPSAFVCLEHWEHLCECNPSKLCLLYRQTLAELSDLLHKVTPISEGPWSSEVATQSMNCFSEISSCDQSDALIKKVQGGHATYKQLAEDWISTTRQIFEVPFYDNACIDALKAAEQFLWAGHEMDMVRCIVTDLMKAQKWSMDVRNCLSNVETWLNQRNGDRGKVLFTDIVGLLHVDSLPCIEPGYTKLKAFIEDASKLLAKVKSVLSSHTCTTVAALEALYAQTIDLPILLEESRELAREISRKSKSSYGSRLCKTPDHQFMASRSSKSLTPSRKSMPSRLSRVIGNEELKRGSIYRSSESVRKLQGLRTIQSSLNRDVSLTFTIIDSLSRPSKNEGDSLAHKKRSPQITSNTVHSLSYVGKNYIESNYTKCTIPSCNLPADRISTPKKVIDGPPDDFLEICLDSKDAKWCCRESVAGLLEASLTEELKLTCDQTSIPESDGNVLLEREKTENLSKSASAKVGMADWPSQSESNFSKAIPKLRFSPLRRMLGPIKKSKSQRDLPFSTRNADGTTTTSKSPSIMRDVTLRKSLLHDFSKVTHLTESDEALFKNKLQNSVSASSPVHLQGLLKLEYKHDALSFEFSVRDPEEILAAKIWKTDNALNWVYTFYSIAGKKRSNRQKQLLMVGQMQVSCYLCSEMRSGSLDTSTVMEFVLFDVAQARKSLACQEDQAGEGLGASDYEFSSLSETDRRTFPQAHSLLKNGSDSSDAYPWNPTDLRSHLEVAAVVIQVPFEKRESLKGKMGEKVEGTTSPDGDLLCRSTSLKNVTVVTASGTHGLPNTKEGWPSRLLDRWRYGGGCDCGGWDMTCPIVVLNNPSVKNATDPPFAEDPWPPELFVQGSKERIPAVTITATGEGEYSIAFHARLSTLQAFSICVALLHTTEVSATVGQEQNAYRLQCNSLKLLLEEEVKYLVEAVTDEEKRKVTKRKGDVSPYLVPDPPFSPIGRV